VEDGVAKKPSFGSEEHRTVHVALRHSSHENLMKAHIFASQLAVNTTGYAQGGLVFYTSQKSFFISADMPS
jgi:hypothetical protein